MGYLTWGGYEKINMGMIDINLVGIDINMEELGLI